MDTHNAFGRDQVALCLLLYSPEARNSKAHSGITWNIREFEEAVMICSQATSMHVAGYRGKIKINASIRVTTEPRIEGIRNKIAKCFVCYSYAVEEYYR
jgi:hypothetical protein